MLCVLKKLKQKLTLMGVFYIASAIFVMQKTTSFWGRLRTWGFAPELHLQTPCVWLPQNSLN